MKCKHQDNKRLNNAFHLPSGQQEATVRNTESRQPADACEPLRGVYEEDVTELTQWGRNSVMGSWAIMIAGAMTSATGGIPGVHCLQVKLYGATVQHSKKLL